MAPCCPAGQRTEYYINAENNLTIDTGALWAGPAVLQVVCSAASIELQLMTSDGRSVCHVGALRHDACAGELCQRRVRWTRRLPRRSASTRRLPMEITAKVRCTTESVLTTTMRVPAVMQSTTATRPMDDAFCRYGERFDTTRVLHPCVQWTRRSANQGALRLAARISVRCM